MQNRNVPTNQSKPTTHLCNTACCVHRMGILRCFHHVLKIQNNSGGWGIANDNLRLFYTLFRYIALKHCVLLKLIYLKKYAYYLHPKIISWTVTGPLFLSRNTNYGNVVPFEELLFALLWYGKF